MSDNERFFRDAVTEIKDAVSILENQVLGDLVLNLSRENMGANLLLIAGAIKTLAWTACGEKSHRLSEQQMDMLSEAFETIACVGGNFCPSEPIQE